MIRLLVVTAVDAECVAIRSTVPGIDVIAGGVGPAAAAAAASAALARGAHDLVLSAGIGGGFGPVGLGEIAVASRIVFADLGVHTADGYVPASLAGFGVDSYDVDPQLAIELADRTGGHLGSVLTVATVTGTAEAAAGLAARFPDAVAEGMEGAGVAAAAALHGVRYAELRAISNPVGPRDRAAWRIPEALHALGAAVATVAAGLVP